MPTGSSSSSSSSDSDEDQQLQALLASVAVDFSSIQNQASKVAQKGLNRLNNKGNTSASVPTPAPGNAAEASGGNEASGQLAGQAGNASSARAGSKGSDDEDEGVAKDEYKRGNVGQELGIIEKRIAASLDKRLERIMDEWIWKVKRIKGGEDDHISKINKTDAAQESKDKASHDSKNSKKQKKTKDTKRGSSEDDDSEQDSRQSKRKKEKKKSRKEKGASSTDVGDSGSDSDSQVKSAKKKKKKKEKKRKKDRDPDALSTSGDEGDDENDKQRLTTSKVKSGDAGDEAGQKVDAVADEPQDPRTIDLGLGVRLFKRTKPGLPVVLKLNPLICDGWAPKDQPTRKAVQEVLLRLKRERSEAMLLERAAGQKLTMPTPGLSNTLTTLKHHGSTSGSRHQGVSFTVSAAWEGMQHQLSVTMQEEFEKALRKAAKKAAKRAMEHEQGIEKESKKVCIHVAVDGAQVDATARTLGYRSGKELEASMSALSEKVTGQPLPGGSQKHPMKKAMKAHVRHFKHDAEVVEAKPQVEHDVRIARLLGAHIPMTPAA